MNNLTLIIPAKNESISLPIVLKELEEFKIKKIVILEKSDLKTIESIKDFDCKILYQTGKGYGNALIEGMKNVQTEYLCIFNADGSFNPKYLEEMLLKCEQGLDFVFASNSVPGTDVDAPCFDRFNCNLYIYNLPLKYLHKFAANFPPR